jgi:aryl-alcohol dehydrogenase-like predicted oxidoreductase
MMKTRMLGKRGFEVSEVGLGCWQFGGDFGEMSEDTAARIMEAAVQGGINFFDTANVYGGGRSERLIGTFLKQTAAPVTVATKYGRGPGVYPDNHTEETLRPSVERSLEDLGTDRIDLLQLHCIPAEALREGRIFDALRKLREEGLIGAFGASVETVEEGMLCLDQADLLSLQIIFNVFRQKPALELLPRAAECGVGIIVRLPLASGLLTGKFTVATTFAPSDHRTYNRDGQCFNVGETFAGLPFQTGVALADRVASLVPEGLSMTQMALRWILDHEAVSVVIPGASSPAQAAQNAAVSALDPLPRELHDALGELYRNAVHHHVRGAY